MSLSSRERVQLAAAHEAFVKATRSAWKHAAAFALAGFPGDRDLMRTDLRAMAVAFAKATNHTKEVCCARDGWCWTTEKVGFEQACQERLDMILRECGLEADDD